MRGDESNPAPWIYFAVLGLLALAFYFAGIVEIRRRRRVLAAWAAGHGFSFDPDRIALEYFYAFRCLKEGDNRYASNRIRGRHGAYAFTAFDYHYETGGGRRKTAHHFSAVILDAPYEFPSLLIRPEGVMDKLSALLGGGRIQFESLEFNKHFRVQCEDRRFASDVLHPRAIQMLLDSPRYSIELNRHAAIVWSPVLAPPGCIPAAAELAGGLLDQMPDYLKEQIQFDLPDASRCASRASGGAVGRS